ncbi:MAG TPA: hypothetical protein DEO88_00580, partial [Syntrophobacteraceae bacterium]|nr:hypothetical protein [Syntrophobacteraceae bacterium]
MVDPHPPMHELDIVHILKDILESVNDAVIIADVHQRIRFFNVKAEEVFGYDRGEVLGQDLTLLIAEDYRENHRGFLDRCAERGQLTAASEIRRCTGRRKDG